MKKKNQKYFIIFILAVISLWLFLTGCSKSVATVDDMNINRSEVDKYFNFLKSQSQGITLPEDEEEIKEIEIRIIDSIIVSRLLERYAEKNNIVVSKSEVEERFNLIADSYPTKSDFKNDLKEMGIDEKFLKAEIENQILRENIFQKVTEGLIVSPEEMEGYYNENKDTLFVVPQKIRISHIMINFLDEEKEEVSVDVISKEEALDKIKYIRQKLDDGEKFEDLAREYSDDKLSGENGGDIGFVSGGQLVEQLEKVAFSLEVGEISRIVESQYAYHILKVTEVQKEYIESFEEVKDSIEYYLINTLKREKWEEFIFNLMEDADIKYHID